MSLAIAAHRLSEALEAVLSPVHVVVDTPSATAEMVKSNTNEDFLNIFLYRVAPSTVHAAQRANEPFFLRVFALLTPFARRDTGNGGGNGGGGGGNGGGGGGAGAGGPADYPDLQILTDAIQYFHENPVSEILHARDGAQGTAYRIHAIPQAPEMEEMNHIWTTQNSALGYRLSAAYEFSLIPVDPAEIARPAPPVRSAIAQVDSDLARRDDSPVGYGTGFVAFPGLSEEDADIWNGPAHLPQILARLDGALVPTLEIAASATSVDLRLAGPTERRAVITTTYLDADGAPLDDSTSRRSIRSATLTSSDGDFTHTLNLPDGTRSIVIAVRGGTETGGDLSLDRVGNTLTLTVKEA